MMKKRVLAWMLCLMMAFTSCAPAFAEGESGSTVGLLPTNCIAAGTNQTHSAGGNPATAQSNSRALDLTFSKTLTEVIDPQTNQPIENAFNINLEVKTNQDITKTLNISDAAVVLVFDLSGSMDVATQDESTQQYTDRLDKAKAAALGFLQEFGKVNSGPTNGVDRMVSIVGYDKPAWLVANWTNIVYTGEQPNGDGYESIKNAIEKLTHKGSTNTEAGLQIAYNLYESPNLNAPVKDIDNKNVILLTDGVPIEFIPNSVYGYADKIDNQYTIDSQLNYFTKESLTLAKDSSNNITFQTVDNADAAAKLMDDGIKNTVYSYTETTENNTTKYTLAGPHKLVQRPNLIQIYQLSKDDRVVDNQQTYRDAARDQYRNWGYATVLKDADGKTVSPKIEVPDYGKFPYYRRVMPYIPEVQTNEMGRAIRSAGISLYGVPIDMTSLYIATSKDVPHLDLTAEQKQTIITGGDTVPTSEDGIADRIYELEGADGFHKRIAAANHYYYYDKGAADWMMGREPQVSSGPDTNNKPTWGSLSSNQNYPSQWCDYAFNVTSDNVSGWTDTFNRIFQLIRENSAAWEVTDVLSENVQMRDDITTTPLDKDGNQIDCVEIDGKTITWDLKELSADAKPDKNGYYTYTSTIPVTLTNTGANMGTWLNGPENGIPTNDSASLNYLFVKNVNGVPSLDGKDTKMVDSPSVHALYADGLSLTKNYILQDSSGNPVSGPMPLGTAEFTLTVNSLVSGEENLTNIGFITSDGISKTTETNAHQNNLVLTSLPAGTYTLTETKVPDGYHVQNGEGHGDHNHNSWQFTVRYGKIYHGHFAPGVEPSVPPIDQLSNSTSSGTSSSNQMTGAGTTAHHPNNWFTNIAKLGSLTISKTVVSDLAADLTKDFTFEVALKSKDNVAITSGSFASVWTGLDEEGEEVPLTDKPEQLAFETDKDKLSFTLKHGQSVQIDLPHDVTYTVTETNDSDFETEIVGSSTGTINAEANNQSSVGFTNTRKTGDLTLTKQLSGTYLNTTDKAKAFNFQITLDDPTINKEYPITPRAPQTAATVKFEDGVANVDVFPGETRIISGLPSDLTYTIWEFFNGSTQAEADAESALYDIAVTTNPTGTIVAGNTPVAFTAANTRKTGSLKIEKAFTGKTVDNKGTEDTADDVAFDEGKEFSVTVTLSEPITATVTAQDGNTVNTVNFTRDENASTVSATFPLTKANPVILTGLPVGVGYTVTETDADTAFFEEPVITNRVGTIAADTVDPTTQVSTINTPTVVVTNERKTAVLHVTKKVDSPITTDPQEEFTFTITLETDGGSNGNFGLYGISAETLAPVSFNSGVAVITAKLKADDTLKLINLPAGVTYTVSEAEHANFDQSVAVETFADYPADSAALTQNIAQGVLAPNGDAYHSAHVTVTNTRKTADLTVIKEDLAGPVLSRDQEFVFEIWLDGMAEGETFDAVIASTTGSDSQPTKVEFKKQADPQGRKPMLNSTDAEDVIPNNTELVRAFVSIKSSHAITISGLPANVRYRVREWIEDDDAPNYTVIPKGASGTLPLEGAVASFINKRLSNGSLYLSKYVESPELEPKHEFTFNILLDPAASVPNGDYTVLLSHNDKPAEETESKLTFTGGAATIVLPANTSAEIMGLPQGFSYTISEAEHPDYTMTESSGTEGIIPSTGGATVAFTNTRDLGNDLTISKKVVSPEVNPQHAFTFTLTLKDIVLKPGLYGQLTIPEQAEDAKDTVATFTLKNGEEITISGVPAGVKYVVAEDEHALYTPDTAVYEGVFGLKGDDAIVHTFLNTRKTGSFTITKQTAGTSYDPTLRFPFTVTLTGETGNAAFRLTDGVYGTLHRKDGATEEVAFTSNVASFSLAHGDWVKLENLPQDIGYAVEETMHEDYISSCTTSNAISTVPAEHADVIFLNQRVSGGLQVRKIVSGNGGDTEKEFPFTVTLSDTTINGKMGDMLFNNGVATFSLKHGQDIIATDLPSKTTYTVEETAYGDYVMTSTGETGTIQASPASVATFTNTRRVGDLTIAKFVDDATFNLTGPFAFELTITSDTVPSEAITGKYGDVTFTNGKAIFTIMPEQTVLVSGLPAGAAYALVELGVDDTFIPLCDNPTGVVREAENVLIKVTNRSLIPDTGDHSRLGVYVALLALCSAGLVILLRKRCKNG